MTDAFAMMLFLMLAGHALADGPLQPPELSRGKRDPNFGRALQALTIHSLIHGGAVALITGRWWLGAAETIAHFSIDFLKCGGHIGHGTDQALHLACKIAWALIAIGAISLS
jgi:hypothetical protein